MMREKTKEKFIKAAMRDERKASKEYRKMGFPNIAKDERKHRRILLRALEKM